ncbi:MAG: DUF3987 domain-containing protein [Planctomycetia bacterium]
MMNNTSAGALEQCHSFLAAIFEPDDVIEFRPLKPASKRWGRLTDLPEVIRWVAGENKRGKHAYFGANPRRSTGHSDAAGVLLARCLFADFDKGATREQALEKIDAAGLPAPTALLHSGGGIHAWWRLTEPMNDAANWTKAMKAIIAAVGSDGSIHDWPRIMRLPGFVNWKYEHKPAAELLDVDTSRVYPLDRLTPKRLEMSWLSRDFLEHGEMLPAGRRQTMFTVACDLNARGWSVDDATARIMERMNTVGLPSEDIEDCRRQIANAFKRDRTPVGAEPVAAVAAEPDDEDDEVIEWQPFPSEQLPEPLAAFVKETARGIGCDESMVALPLLAAVAGAIGNARAIEPRPGWVEPSVIWAGVVAESGSGKTPAFRAAMQFADAEQKVAFDAHHVALAAFDAAEMEHDAAFADWKKEKGNKGPAPDRPVKPSARRLVVNDTTIEGLVPILADNPRGVLVAVDELAGLVASFDAYKSGGRGGADRPKWLSMHSAGPLTVDRKGSGTTYVARAAVSVCGGVQPGVLAKTMTTDNVDSGLLGRLLLTMPPRRHRQWVEEPVGWQTIEGTKSLFGSLYAMPMPADGPKVLDLTPDALTVFKVFWEEHEHEVFSSSGALRAMLAKVEAAVVRFALIVHLARQAAGETIPDRVDVESMTRAIVLGRWFAREGRRVYGVLLGGRAVDRAADDAAAAERWIEGKGGFASVRDLRKSLARFRDDDDRAEQAARRLVAERRARWEAPITGGRPADGIRLAG